ncbi:MAG: DUF2339 domain-containing protein [Flavobacteriales bacterium]|nr:DUF2339 domain-containing protein [Flavobacteriales bacterium]
MSVFLICILLLLLIIFHLNNTEKLKRLIGSVRKVQYEVQAIKMDFSSEDKPKEHQEKFKPRPAKDKPKPEAKKTPLVKDSGSDKKPGIIPATPANSPKKKESYNIIPASEEKKKTEKKEKEKDAIQEEVLSQDEFEKKYGLATEEEEVVIPAKKVAATPAPPRNRPPGGNGPKSPKPKPQPAPKKPKTDWEKFIGQNLMNKIGIAILVLGIGFFVKYAIDQEWINEIGRVAIGIGAGGLLLGFAHIIRRNYKTFSSILVGGGLAVFYITIAIGFHEYHLFTQKIAFTIMSFITGLSVFMSIAYDRIELAILSLIGGFTAPFLVSQGSGNYVALFTYMAILNVGMMVLAYFKNWKWVSTISYVLTVLVYAGWLSYKVLTPQIDVVPPYQGAFFFAAIFFLIFFVTNIIYNVRKGIKFSGIQFSILLSNNLFFFSAGIAILNNIQDGFYNGLFTAVMGLINLVFALGLFYKKGVDKNLLYLLVGLVLTFVSLVAPIQLEGNHITLFWATELVLMLFLANKSKIKLLHRGALGLSALLMVSLAMDWAQLYVLDYEGILPIATNKAFITGLISGLAMIIASRVCRKSDEMILTPISHKGFRNFLGSLGIITVYAAILFEFIYQLNVSVHLFASRVLLIALFNMLMISAGVAVANYRNKPLWKEILFMLSLGVIFVFPFLLHPNIKIARDAYISSGAQDAFIGFGAHYMILGLLAFLMIQAVLHMKRKYGLRSETAKVFYWFFSALGLFVLSAELDHTVLLSNATNPAFNEAFLIKQTHKIGYPILWGISSFGIMLLGMKNKMRTLRIISLSVFGVILLKLFIIDIKGMTQGGRIASFIILGVLLLVISFLYQKVKELFFEKDGELESPSSANQ